MLILLLFTVWFTIPRYAAVSETNCNPDTLPSQVSSWTLIGQQQSITWLARRDSMHSSDDAWARWWPIVAQEAMPQQLATYPLTPDSAGKYTGRVIPDSISGSCLFFRVSVSNGHGTPCESPIVQRPGIAVGSTLWWRNNAQGKAQPQGK